MEKDGNIQRCPYQPETSTLPDLSWLPPAQKSVLQPPAPPQRAATLRRCVSPLPTPRRLGGALATSTTCKQSWLRSMAADMIFWTSPSCTWNQVGMSARMSKSTAPADIGQPTTVSVEKTRHLTASSLHFVWAIVPGRQLRWPLPCLPHPKVVHITICPDFNPVQQEKFSWVQCKRVDKLELLLRWWGKEEEGCGWTRRVSESCFEQGLFKGGVSR